ncbi:NAD-dependent dehydratase [Marinobacter halodurans]|uniref:NAD-dependent dehydratase n=1 Tax=Marinobacter halodurans TaxID=2528979 RepID=A0ABY1ZHC4_9GAMM|nr:NAD-dependent dehydratase [Marinobacter halodurans]TBW52533.1 NAD-dependent dehydratase [Marinobacter halodurans]
MELLLLGATGAVGREVLKLALNDPSIPAITAPTRRPLPPHEKLHNPVVDFTVPLPAAGWWQADALLCCLGTTIRKAGSQAGFRAVDHDLILEAAQKAHDYGTRVMVLNSSLGANSASRNFYLRTKGETEDDLRQIGFRRLVLVRPSLIDADREEPRFGEKAGLVASRLLRPIIPAHYRAVSARSIARTMLDSVLGSDGVRVIESEDIR